ncbi:MAG: DUF3971 domain-containing protein [Pseudomonadales bacterium]
MAKPSAGSTRWLWPWLLLFAALALYGGLGRVALASLEGQRAELLDALQAQLGVPVSATALRGRFSGFSPVLELEGLRLGSREAPAVTAEALALELDVLESLYRRLPIARRLVLRGVAIALEKDEAGLRLRGFPTAPADAALPAQVLQAIYHADAVTLENVSLALGSAQRWRLAGELRNGWFWNQGALALSQEDGAPGASGTLSYELRGDPLLEGDREGRILGRLSRLNRGLLTPWIPEAARLPGGSLEALALEGTFDRESGFQFRLRAEAPKLRFSDQLEAETLSLELLGKRLTQESGALWLRTLQGRLAGVPVSFSDAALGWRGGVDPELRVFLPLLSLRTASELAAAWPGRPERVDTWLRRLALDGQLTDLRLRLNPEKPLESLAFSAALGGLRATAYRGVPTVRGLDGRLQATARGATFELDSGPFYLHFPRVFAAGWQYDAGTGALALQWSEAGLEMEGWDLALRGEAAQAEGAFSLRLTPEEANRRLALDLNITQADALFLGAYLPEKLEPGLRGWLLEAVRGGRVERGKFVLYGPMKPERKEARSASLALAVREGRLRPAPGWPELAQIESTLWLEPEAAYGTVAGANLQGLSLSEGRFTLPAEQAPRRLALSAKGEGSGEALLNFLRTAPLGPGLEFLNEDWEAAGSLSLDLDLGMVLGQAPDHLAVATTLEGVALALGRSRLTLEDLRGTVTYSHPGALSAQELTGTLFDGPLRAAITGSLEDGGLAFASEGDLRGEALTRWLRIPYLDGLAGAMSYTSDLRIERSGALELSASSEAVDLRTGLPAPLDARDSVLDFRYQQTDLGETPSAWLQLAWGGLAARASFEA